jgi:hypothetical protein
MLNKSAKITPFIGIEAGFALSNTKVDPADYYRDYVINTGNRFLGDVDPYSSSPVSFTRGHFPVWEVAHVVGVRFGRRKL